MSPGLGRGLYIEQNTMDLTIYYREKGVIHIASAAVDNALWDLFAKSRQKPLWKLIVDMSPVSPYCHSYAWDLADSLSGGTCAFHMLPVCSSIMTSSGKCLIYLTWHSYITDVITPQEALEMLQKNAPSKSEREAKVREIGYAVIAGPNYYISLTYISSRYPAYITSAGWLRQFCCG